MNITNYIKSIARRPLHHTEQLFGLADGGTRYFEELWFFDDTDQVSINVALDKAQAFQARQPMGTRFQTSVWRPIAAAKRIPAVGEQPKGTRTEAA